MRPIYFLLTFLLLFTQALRAQTPYLAWQNCFGGPYVDDGEAIIPTSDGGYIMTGSVGGPGGNVVGYHGNPEVGDCWVIKLSSTGTLQWQVCLGGDDYDDGSVVLQTSDGGYLVGGQSATPAGNGNVTSTNHGGTDFWVVKLNGTGVIQWENSYGGELNEYLYGMQPTPDGGYVLAGCTQSVGGQVSGNHGGQDYWVVKINSTGTLQWQKCLGGSNDDFAYGVAVCADGTLIVNGYTTSNDGNVTGYHGAEDMWVVKLDAGGNVLWQHCLGGSGQDVGWAVVATADGGCVAAGYAQSSDGDVVGNHGVGDMWAVSLSSSTGAIRWQGCYGGSSNEFAYNIAATADGGYLLAGSTNSNDGEVTCYDADSYQMGWVVKTNGTGVLQWETVLGGDFYDEEHSVQPTPDGGAIVGGYTASNDLPNYHADVGSTIGDFYVAKLTPPPTATINTPDTLCAGSVFNFMVKTSPAAPANTEYEWVINGSPAGVGNIYAIPGLVNGDQVYCQVTIEVFNGCSLPTVINSDTVTVAIRAIQPSSISIGYLPTAVCSGQPQFFTATVAGGGVSPTYQWEVNGNPIGSSDSPTLTSTLGPGDVVSCTVADTVGCIASSTASVNPVVNATPIVGTGPAIVLSKGNSTTLELPVTGDVAGYTWTPDLALSDPDVADPVATPSSTTTYTLTVSSPAGCMDSGQLKVEVFSPLAIPNAFSPNGDGHNDIFYVIGGPVGSVVKEFAVFDRWGQRVFQAHDTAPDDPAFGWNGNIGGQPAPMGAYVYEIVIGLADGTHQLYRGTVMLVR